MKHTNKFKLAAIEYHQKGYTTQEFSNNPKFWREVRKESEKRLKIKQKQFNEIHQ